MQRLKNGWGFDSTRVPAERPALHPNYNCEDDYSGGGEGFDRPDVVGPIVYHKHNPAEYIDLSSFAMPCTHIGCGRSFRQPAFAPGLRARHAALR